MTNADPCFFVKSTCAYALIHEAFHGLLVRPTMKLIAVLITVATGTMRDSSLAQHMNLMFLTGTIVGFHRKGIVLLAANALALAAV